MRLPLADVRSLISLRHGEGLAAPWVTGKPGRLEMDGVRLQGQLVPGVGHLSLWAILGLLLGAFVVLLMIGLRSFERRILT